MLLIFFSKSNSSIYFRSNEEMFRYFSTDQSANEDSNIHSKEMDDRELELWQSTFSPTDLLIATNCNKTNLIENKIWLRKNCFCFSSLNNLPFNVDGVFWIFAWRIALSSLVTGQSCKYFSISTTSAGSFRTKFKLFFTFNFDCELVSLFDFETIAIRVDPRLNDNIIKSRQFSFDVLVLRCSSTLKVPFLCLLTNENSFVTE